MGQRRALSPNHPNTQPSNKWKIGIVVVNQKVKSFFLVATSRLTPGEGKRLDSCFGSLAHPIRRAMIAQLSRGDATVTELAKPHSVSLPAISKHIHILDDAGLVKIQPDGSLRRVHLRAKPLHDAFTWLAHYQDFWEERLDRLTRQLESKNKDD